MPSFATVEGFILLSRSELLDCFLQNRNVKALRINALVAITATGVAIAPSTGARIIGVAMADGATGNRIPVFLGLPGILSP